jgi:ABC-2 type transport system permease protein
MMGFLKGPTRVLAWIGKELVEILRRPAALVSLTAGPFIIMVVFGLGYVGRPPLNAILVVPAGSGLPQSPTAYSELGKGGISVVGVVNDPETARAALHDGSVDLAIITPADGAERFKAGQQSTIIVEYDTTDPVKATYATSIAAQVSAEANRLIIEQAARQAGQQFVVGDTPIPPEVIAAPTRAEARDIAPSPPGVVAYFAPAVLALIIQHMGISLGSISLTRERFGGILEMLRVAPISVSGMLAGKTAALLALLGGTAAALLALLRFGLNVPVLGGPVWIVAAVVALCFASIGLGLALSSLADSERHAVQLSLLLLLASVFFGGFALDLNQFAEPIRVSANALPVTHGIRLVQDLLLRGEVGDPWRLGLLVAMGVVFFLFSWLFTRRSLRPS